MLGRKGRNFARDERGVTAIEFGILALPFFMIIGATLETSTPATRRKSWLSCVTPVMRMSCDVMIAVALGASSGAQP